MHFTVKVGSARLQITPGIPPDDFKELRKKLSYIVHNFRFTRAHKERGWDGTKTLLYKNQTAPAGCAIRVVDELEEMGHDVTLQYINDYPPKGEIKVHGLTLADFQIAAVKKCVKYRRGIVQAPVRAGKTAIAAALLNRIYRFPAVFVTNGKDLVRQSQKDLAYHLDMPVGSFSEGCFEHAQVLVTSYQALTRAVTDYVNTSAGFMPKRKSKTQERNQEVIELLRSAKVVVFDECHHALAYKYSKILQAITSAGYVIGLSGTPKGEHTPLLELEAALGKIISKVHYKTLIKHKRLAEPKIIVYEMPHSWYDRLSARRYSDAYQTNIIENMHRNRFIADIVNRLKTVGKTAFIMIRHLAHGPILRSLIPGSIFVQGKMRSQDRAGMYEALQNKKLWCIIGTVGKEGLNIPKLDAVINAEGLAANIATMQKMRSLTATEGKKYGMVFDFIDWGKFLHRHSERRLKVYESIGNVKIKIRKVPKDLYSREA